MSATTIKIPGPILKELKGFKRPDQSLSALIREFLHAEIRRRKMAQAAQDYVSFVRENPAEYLETETWSAAQLDQDPAGKKPK